MCHPPSFEQFLLVYLYMISTLVIVAFMVVDHHCAVDASLHFCTSVVLSVILNGQSAALTCQSTNQAWCDSRFLLSGSECLSQKSDFSGPHQDAEVRSAPWAGPGTPGPLRFGISGLPLASANKKLLARNSFRLINRLATKDNGF